MTTTQKKQKIYINKRQMEFFNFIEEKIMPLFSEKEKNFDLINPSLEQEWNGNNILIIIPYGDLMQPWLHKVIQSCYENENRKITVIMGAKVNSNAWHNYVFPFAESFSFVRGGKRPTAIVEFNHNLRYSVFSVYWFNMESQKEEKTKDIFKTFICYPNKHIEDYLEKIKDNNV